ncbi:MAG: GNAT family N-acetyltransferase [Gemmatimonadota bacterium]
MTTSFRLLSEHDSAELTDHLLRWKGTLAPLDQGLLRREVSRALDNSGAAHAWLIEQGSNAIGYLVLSFRSAGPAEAYVTGLYLAPDFRGLGIGRQALRLVDDVGRWLRVRVHHFQTESESKHAFPRGRVSGRSLSTVGSSPAIQEANA